MFFNQFEVHLCRARSLLHPSSPRSNYPWKVIQGVAPLLVPHCTTSAQVGQKEEPPYSTGVVHPHGEHAAVQWHWISGCNLAVVKAGVWYSDLLYLIVLVAWLYHLYFIPGGISEPEQG